MGASPTDEGTLNESHLLGQLPDEIAALIRTASGTQYLNALAVGALRPGFTEKFFYTYEPIFVDLAARWTLPESGVDPVEVISAFARILPLAPHLRSFASQYAMSRAGPLSALAVPNASNNSHLDNLTTHTLLLAIFRLLSFDLEAFSPAVAPSQLQSLFRHEDQVIRFLAVRCFCLYMRAADAATERIERSHCGDDILEGRWEGISIDYRCLGLWEERRWVAVEKQLGVARAARSYSDSLAQVEHLREYLTGRTAEVCGVLIPRQIDTSPTTSSIVKTPTAVNNLRRIASSLVHTQPILLVGLPNSGKTSLINDVAASMGQFESMVTLHLNEQTDAKSLLGMYSTSPATGSFAWQPGVLTKAAREGRWILIEDLDRAPSEVIGLILPIIEKGELTIASRRERIKCAEGFRIIATMKSSYNIAGEEVAPSTTVLGSRLWNRVQVDPLNINEVQEVIAQKFPILQSRVPTIMSVYQSVCSSFHGSLAIKSSQGRTPGLRDLIKLCSRMHKRLQRLGVKTGLEATPEGTDDDIFLDAVDLFLKYIPDTTLSESLALKVAESLHISPQRARFNLYERTPTLLDQGNNVILGREACRKVKVPSGSASKLAAASSRFATTRAALKLMEQVAASVEMAEPVLLVGETGIGKTTVIQHLGTLMRQKLTVVNLSQQSESTDLLGGFKPVNIRTMAIPMFDEFTSLFELTFSAKKNQKFLSSIAKNVANGNWVRLVNHWHEAVRLADGVFKSGTGSSQTGEGEQPAKKRKLDSPKYQLLRQRWERFSVQLNDFEAQVAQGDAKFAFAFVQGKIVRALRNGEWVLLDEVNLASPDTLENIASLLHHGSEGSPSVLLSEAGDVERVFGHPDFRIFGAMNPATDAGKKDLPPGLRSRFTELYVQSPDNELDDLLSLIQKYLGDLTLSDARAASDLAQLYMEAKKLSNENKLTDGAGQRPHFSIRTLVRALIYAADHAQVYGLRRAIFEGFSMSFLTVLSMESERLLSPLLEKHIFSNVKNIRALLGQTPRPPNDGNDYVQFKHYWMRKGHLAPEEQPHYIITPFIEKNLKNLVRASSTRRFPVLLQGPTSAGKTSMIEYLAKVSGNKFVRINNHEHTDLQEYLGSYVSDDDGTLRYQEGILVEALRNGYWIVLDELNLAPSDVLEALNRLLDDNRELFIPETQEVVRPHSNFMLFATQNPAGLYGGRKVLSRAFRNRFLELHFDDIPESELEYILKERSQIAPSFCTRIVSVYRKLSLLRQANRLFEQKNSFATLRDLFRWALRQADDREQLAINGFMLLAERVRNPQERAAVKGVIEEVMKVTIDEDVLYSTSEMDKRAPMLRQLTPGLVWTRAMRRLFILVSTALQNNEPILLVGETGCGKTQLCQAVADAYQKQLHIINAHVNLETGDLIGAQRPVRNRSAIEDTMLSDLRALLQNESKTFEELKQEFGALSPEQRQACDPELLRKIEKNSARLNALFEWTDGSLITAMKTGQFFLLDEISLADDSVLERLNSVLEPHRSILLAEKGPLDSMVIADNGFQFLSTMNPGGDYGKRELSAALRNRMTEIWAPQLSEDEDILPILHMKLQTQTSQIPQAMLQFAKWFKRTLQGSSTSSLSIRDLLAWVDFVNKCQANDPMFAVVQGAAMVFIDTLGANPAAMLASTLHNLEQNRHLCLDKLRELFDVDASSIYFQKSTIDVEERALRVGPFYLTIQGDAQPDPDFIMDAPTTVANSVRIARGLQLTKPILLEGSPGVGKTTLVTALARALGKPLTRINLSEQTDLTDLFGSDVPVEGGDVGQFAWRDAPFLQAMQRGDWVLLDEMNLASQSVLEGLNACLDHRQMVYIAELDQSFKRHPDFVLFAAQNPHHQGGGRKGLPASFVNRFTVVYADSFTDTDLKRICAKLFPGSPATQTERLVDFVASLNVAIAQERSLGVIGGPWEVNLRDIQRWLQLADRGSLQIHTKNFLDVIISQRFRCEEDRERVSRLYERVFDGVSTATKSYYHNLTPEYMQVGLGVMRRDAVLQATSDPQLKILPRDLSVLESLMLCIEQSWPSILVGPSGCGKTTLIRKLAATNGASLVELALSADTDTMDLVGGFEQIDHSREMASLLQDIVLFLKRHILSTYPFEISPEEFSAFVELYERLQSPELSLERMCTLLESLCQVSPDPNLERLLARSRSLFNFTRESEHFRVGFEWTEGVLTQAVLKGDWVILDNANLCNPSVLDRLNSLTEPNGSLILNEQRTEDGNARVIKPHPNFRLFLTMDSRNGELSRAMRNRCVEICILPKEEETLNYSSTPTYTSQSSLYRLRSFWALNSPASEDLLDPLYANHLDHLSVSDLAYLQRTQHMVLPQLFSSSAEKFSRLLNRYVSVIHDNQNCQPFDVTKKTIDLGDVAFAISGNLQPLHPLVNEPLALVLEQDLPLNTLVSLAKLQEFKLDLHDLKQELLLAEELSKSLKPSQMTRLQRSLASKRIPSLMKDSTQPVARFISNCGQAVYDFVQSLDIDFLSHHNPMPPLRAIIDFCADVLKITADSELDEGEFLIYLQLGKSLCTSISDLGTVFQPLVTGLSQALERFHDNWALSSGLGMQKLWESWRPATASSHVQLASLLDLENVAFEFMQVATRTRLDLSQLSQVRNSLIETQKSILQRGADEGSLVQSLRQTVQDLATLVENSELAQTPYFSNEFEVLCQYHDIAVLNESSPAPPNVIQSVLALLAGRPAQPTNTSTLQSKVPDLLHRISLFSGYHRASGSGTAIEGTVSISLLNKLAFVDRVNLGQMGALEVEKRTLSQALALTTQEIALDQLKLLRQALLELTAEFVDVHKEYFSPQSYEQLVTLLRLAGKRKLPPSLLSLNIRLAHNLPSNHYFRAIADKALPKLVVSLLNRSTGEDATQDTASALVQLAVILLWLFVPDKPYDPSLSLVVDRKRHQYRVAELTSESDAIALFEKVFSGQATNIRLEIAQSELRDLGAAPPPSSVTRPPSSELSILHGEFSSIIKSVLNRNPENLISQTKRGAQNDHMRKLLRDNIQQLSRRLSTNYRSYDDITTLVVRFLQILDLGLCLGSPSDNKRGEAAFLRTVCQTTPFLGAYGRPKMLTENDSVGRNSKYATDSWFYELSSLRVAEIMEPGLLQTRCGRESLRRIVEQFYIMWKTKLQEDQEEHVRKNEMYHFKGSWEDEEEVDANELNQLFPTYEEGSDQDVTPPKVTDPKAISVRLADLHAKLFQSVDSGKVLLDYVKQSAMLLGTTWSESSGSLPLVAPKEQISAIFLLLEDDLVKRTATPVKSYNFYTDQNLAEAEKLLSLTRSIQARFVQIHNAWPDHAVPIDVISFCKEIYQFKHTEPVAKFLTKVEKLHSHVHEWQLVASREYSAATHYDELTNLIISWRRLELSTWAKLLDLEKDKCEQDVSSWWFIAYEALMRAPIQIAESEQAGLGDHVQEVIGTLEQFTHSTTLGQYSERLRLIKNFRSLLFLYVQDYPSLKQLVSALDNFLQHYAQFEPAISKMLNDKRSALEKDIKEQIQLASWKDTNIVALRESAKRSHIKLFKLVRKYREVLGLPVEQILSQDMPENEDDSSFTDRQLVSTHTSISEALAIAEKGKVWSIRPPRFANPDSTAKSMLHMYTSISDEFDVGKDLSSFVQFFAESIKDFRTQTPKVLTEDNKADVQHLKGQKRRFYADTLRQLLEMGVKRNAGTDLVESQATVAKVLATSPSLATHPAVSQLVGHCDGYFHRLLDLVPRARQASRTYSEELSNVEVSRSLGSMEHLLFMIRKQRAAVAPALSDLVTLQSTLDKVSHLWRSGISSILRSDTLGLNDKQDVKSAVAWLAPTLGLASTIVELHSKFSEVASIPISNGLQTWKDTFDRLRQSIKNLPELPSGVTSKLHQHTLVEAASALSQLKADIVKWARDRPDLTFVLDQILPWTIVKMGTAELEKDADTLGIEDFDSSLTAAVDKILVSLQKLKDVPSAITSTGFLSRSDEFFTRALKSVHLADIAKSLDEVLETLHRVSQQSNAGISLAVALLASLLPIMNMYYDIGQDILCRFLKVHRETCKMSYVLAKSFIQVSSEGFCSPHEESNEEGQTGKLESGTGLGEGEGAEDISKDVGDDEDLSELAQQEQQEGSKDDIDKSKDAVNMDQEDLKGEEGDQDEAEDEEKDESGDEEGDEDIDEEVGSVDDLDAGAVDEKMWDGGHDEQQKETENEEGKGASEADQPTAAPEQQEGEKGEEREKEGEGDEEEEEEDEDEEAPDDEGEAVGREDMDVTDPQAQEQETLELPEEMQLDGDEKGMDDEDLGSDDGLDDLPDAPNDDQMNEMQEDNPEEEGPGDQPGEEEDKDQNEEISPEEENADAAEGEDEAQQQGEEPEEAQQEDFLAQRDENEAAGEEVAPSEAVNGGLGAEQDQNQEKGASGNAQQQDGSTDPSVEPNQQTGAAKEGEEDRHRDAGGADDVNPEDPQLQAFKKLGDVLEQWHRRQKEIMEASKQEEGEVDQPLPQDTEMGDADFEHLADENDVADTQALGQASEEQAKALDQNKGVESEVKPTDQEMLPDASDELQALPSDELEDAMQMDQEGAPADNQAAGAFIPGPSHAQNAHDAQTQQAETEELDEVDSHLAAIHLSSTLPPLTPRDEAQRLWSKYESTTNDLSLSLTEQLRLILAPTLATKLRGDFRTGKRLNIKRIIPYIASQYKRDKIWMRRSVPSKRNYQIMLAVDDSKSMLESGSGQLAFETLALVAKSLSMLEVGDLCVLGFGSEDHVRVAHDFGKPFSSEAGVQVFQNFSYQQTGTNVRKLIADSIALFREARLKQSPGGGGADLWQLELIVSDGICEDHETIRRLVRQAQEERIMIVFIIVDAIKGNSILDLTQASFEPDVESGTGEMKLKMKRYLEGFPFPYYLVVRDVRELPAVLATALKQWFAEVVDVSS